MHLMSLEKKISPEMHREAKEALDNALKDVEVQEFIKKYEDAFDEDTLTRGRLELLKYVMQRDQDPHFKLVLRLFNGNIYIEYEPRNDHALSIKEHNIRLFYRYDDITKPLAGISYDEYDSTDLGHLKAQSFIKNFISNYQFGNGTKGMYLCGARGIGKTFLTGIFCKRLKEKQIGFNFVNTNRMYKDFLNAINYGQNVHEKIKDYQQCEILLLDDLGTEKATEYAINDLLYNILDYRMNHNLPVFINSNYSRYDYKEHLIQAGIQKIDAERLIERIETLTIEVPMSGRNRRNKE